jgi:uncharacterized repeat protein (TIGR03803 family)
VKHRSQSRLVYPLGLLLLLLPTVGLVPGHAQSSNARAPASAAPTQDAQIGRPPSLEQTLYTFCSQGVNCYDGAQPAASPIMDSAGNLYGVTQSGGAADRGTIFMLRPTETGWSQTVLHNFCQQTNCTDGYSPYALAIDSAGELFGTAADGNGGIVFELLPNADKTAWSYTIIYRFCSSWTCSDGAGPAPSLLFDQAGNLYGTTMSTIPYGYGQQVVFKLAPNQDRSAWTETVLYRFGLSPIAWMARARVQVL